MQQAQVEPNKQTGTNKQTCINTQTELNNQVTAEKMSLLVDAFDHDHLWHPYTSATNPLPAFKVVKAQDRTLYLQDGTTLIDAMSSWWCVVHGYNVPQINQALKEQIDKFAHVMFAGLTHDKAIELGKKLKNILPKNLEHIFYADSGSVATEIALKMAVQYQVARGYPEKTSFVTVRAGYHGDTWNAMSVCDPSGMHTLFKNDLPQRYFADNPQSIFPNTSLKQQAICNENKTSKLQQNNLSLDTFDYKDLASLCKILEQHHERIAAFILEPIVQGAGGMYFYHPEYLNEAAKLCKKYEVLLIVDEIATGFGRTGKLFAINHTNIEPDIMLLGKGLTAGYITLAAVACTKEIGKTISERAPYAFMHGPTFMANPLACACACASIDYLFSYDFVQQVQMIEQKFRTGLQKVIHYKLVKDVRVLGAIAVIELKSRMPVANIMEYCLNLGVWLRPMGQLLYAMPPLTTTEEELTKIIDAMCKIVEALDHGDLAQALANTTKLKKESNEASLQTLVKTQANDFV